MADTWNKRVVGYGPGYNTPPSPAPPAMIEVTDLQALGSDTVKIIGTSLDEVGRFRIADDFTFDESFYDSAGPDSGLNPVGATVTYVDAETVTVEYAAMNGLTLTYIQARDAVDGVASEWYGSTVVT